MVQECRMVQLPGKTISHFLINYVCVFHTTQRLLSQRNESIWLHKYLCTNVYSTCTWEFSTLLSKWSFPSCNANGCLYSRQEEGGGLRRSDWFFRKATGSLLNALLVKPLRTRDFVKCSLPGPLWFQTKERFFWEEGQNQEYADKKQSLTYTRHAEMMANIYVHFTRSEQIFL